MSVRDNLRIESIKENKGMKSTKQKVYIAIAVAMIVMSLGLIFYQKITGKTLAEGKSGTRVFAGPITELTLDIGSCEIEVIEADTTDVTVVYSNLSGSLSDHCEGGKASLTYKGHTSGFISNLFGGRKESGTITVTIPKDACFDRAAFEFGAAEVKINGLQAKKLHIAVGAGEVTATDICATEKASLEVGAGEFTAKGVDLKNASLQCGVGSMEIEGLIEGKSSIDCGVGSVEAVIRADESDYSGTLDCGIGEVVFGSTTIDGIGSKKTVATDAKHSFDVDCGIGEVSVRFKK